MSKKNSIANHEDDWNDEEPKGYDDELLDDDALPVKGIHLVEGHDPPIIELQCLTMPTRSFSYSSSPDCS